MLNAESAFETGMETRGVGIDPEHGAVVLQNQRLIEDDGPGIRPYRAGEERYRLPLPKTITLKGETLARKLLHVKRPQAFRAVLVLSQKTANARVTVNGRFLGDHCGRYRAVPTDLIREGNNEVLLEGGDETSLMLIADQKDILRNAPARRERPPRSFKSTDGGRNWETVDGEFFVRLLLFQYAEEGSLTSPVLDLGGEGGPLNNPITVHGVHLEAGAETPGDTELHMQVRTGPTPAYDPGSWSGWRSADRFVPPERDRYLQWRAILTTSCPLRTPSLKGVRAVPQADKGAPGWAKDISVVATHNPELRYTSVPFVYEDFDHPRLCELREKYELDQVVDGANNEFEQMVLLREWVRGKLKFDPPFEQYPAWDADEIIQKGRGFCVQFAITLMQVYQSMGFSSRFVFGFHPGPDAGHEVTEVWSNEYDKWVLMDLPDGFHHVDPQTHVPLSMMEVHERMISAYYGASTIISAANRPEEHRGADRIVTVAGADIEPDPATHRRHDLEPTESPRWNRWANIRMMPRNDFFSRRHPLPPFQGFGWDWSDYVVWHSPQHQEEQFFGYHHVTQRRSDWEWTLNRVRFDLTPMQEEQGRVRIRMATDETPGYETFQIRTDGRTWRATPPTAELELQRGRNRIEMRVRNIMGVSGATSYIELDYRP